MGKKSPAPPPPVDPYVAADAQTQANEATARLQQQLGMVNTNDPYGSVRYTADPTAPGGYASTVTLSPGQQGLYDLGIQAQTGALNTANQQIDRVNTALAQPLTPPPIQKSVGPTDFTADRQAITDAVWNQARSRLDPQWDVAEDRNRSRLANQGLSQNNSAYGTEMDRFGRAKNDAYNQGLYAAIGQGAAEQNTLFGQANQKAGFGNQAQQQDFENIAYSQNQPINQLSALLGQQQVQAPNATPYPAGGVNGTDVLGAFGLNQAGQNNAYNAAVSTTNANNQGTASALAAAAMAAAYIWSDRRLKRDIDRIATRSDGIGVYRFNYLWDALTEPSRVGVMADEVVKVIPAAVGERHGFATVNYDML